MESACFFDLAVPGNGKSIAHLARERKRRTCARIAHKRLLQSGQVDRCRHDGTNQVFRRPHSFYVACSFLDDHDTVIAVDSNGYADIVRLPTFDGSKVARRSQGTLLVSQLTAATVSNTVLQPKFKIRSFRKGSIVAVGNDDGNFRIIATERATQVMPSMLSLHSSMSVPLGVDYSWVNDIQWKGWDIPGPLRRYQRDDIYTLAHQLRNPNGYVSRLTEYYNRVDRIHPFCVWDFYETPSSLLALKIGNDRDHFTLRILDDRYSPANNHRICVDMESTKDCQNIAACFLSETLIACAVHSKSFDKIKMFDVRMTRNGIASSTSILPSFPHCTAQALQTDDTFDLAICEKSITVQLVTEQQESQRHIFSSPLIAALERLHNGSIMVSTTEGMHFVLDSTKRIVRTVKPAEQLVAPVFAVDKEHATVAVYDQKKSSGTIALHTSSLMKYANRQPQRGYKRKGSSRFESSNIETLIHDEVGLATQLSDLTFNDSGTSLLGASKDGDLFCWRT